MPDLAKRTLIWIAAALAVLLAGWVMWRFNPPIYYCVDECYQIEFWRIGSPTAKPQVLPAEAE